MLSRLSIKNVALIESADIEFGEGLNVLSGETGAGKSVILDSVNFVLGAKADRTMIRYGQSECFVKAEFSLSENAKAVEILREMDVETDGEIIISRKFSETGKNTIKINGSTVTAAMLRKVTDALVDVHGQSEHFFLLKESNQLKTLDSVIGQPLEEKKEELSHFLQEKKSVKEKITALGGDEKERERRLDILQFQISEIESVDLKENEETELQAKRNKIVNLEKIISAVKEAAEALSGEGGVADSLLYAGRAVSGITRLDERYAVVADKIEGLLLDAQEVAETLSDIGEELYFDENEAEEIENRLDAIQSLKRKYGASKSEIDEYLEKIRAEFDLLSDCEGQYARLSGELVQADKRILSVCRDLTALRKKYGKVFCEGVTEELKTLNIPNAQFDVLFDDYEDKDVDKAHKNGLDELQFTFSANAGEPVKSLGKIISGGEMSRLMLAIKTRLSDLNGISTYIFDEIDAGISGQTAKVVAEKLARIAKGTQVIAVSHLAQIAAMSDREFLIKKQETDGKTTTQVTALNQNEQINEIVRLLGGTEKDEFAVKHAEELLKQAKDYKTTIK